MRPCSGSLWGPAGARDLESPPNTSPHTAAASHYQATPPGTSGRRGAPEACVIQHARPHAPATPPADLSTLSFRKLQRPARPLSAREWVGTALTLKQMTPKVDASCAA